MKINKIIPFLLLIIFSPIAIFSQSAMTISDTAGSVITPAGMATFTGEVTNQSTSFNQIITDYTGSVITYEEATNQFEALMSDIYANINADAALFLDNSGANIDAAVSADFADFVEAFGQYYGHAMIMSSHLSYPVGYDRIVKFPSVTMGFGGGTAFANVTAIQGSTTGESATMFETLDILPTLGVSINIGIGLSKKWSLRFSIFPNTPINLPTSSDQLQDFNLLFNYGSYRARASYTLLEDKLFGIGISLSGLLGYSNGTLTVETQETSFTPSTSTIVSPINFTITATPSYNAEAICSWNDYTVGSELKLWWNLGFIIPYIGYGISFQYSEISSTFNLNNNVLIEETATADLGGGQSLTSTNSETVTRTSSISSEQIGEFYLNRLILGVEIKITMVRINAEVVFDPLNSLTGVSAGVNASF